MQLPPRVRGPKGIPATDALITREVGGHWWDMEKRSRCTASWVALTTGISLMLGCGDEVTPNGPSADVGGAGAGGDQTVMPLTPGAGGATPGAGGMSPGPAGGMTGTAVPPGDTGGAQGGVGGAGATGSTAPPVGMSGAAGSGGGMTSTETGGAGGADGSDDTSAGTTPDDTSGAETTDTTAPPAGAGIENYNSDFEEFVGEDCDLPEPTLLSTPSHSLPDPFLMSDGSRMSSVSQWACQRAWLKKNLEAFVHGAKPGTPDSVTGSVSASGVEVHVEHEGKSADFSVTVSLPPGASGPVPGMFQADGSGVPSSFLHGEGVAAITYRHNAAESAFNSIYGGGGVADPIKWAWAVSRVIDVLVAERDAGNNDVIDPTGLGTTGCSYAGKSAFIVGAYDERIALGLPVESGTGGLGSYRVVGDRDLGPNNGEDPEQVSEACGQGWLTSNLCSGNVDAIPADAHFLVAMYAPRGFTTLDNNRIGHLGPVAQFAAASAGAEVFKALGVESHVGYHGGNDGDPHNHCAFYPSQEETARKAIRGFLTKEEPPANFMEPKLRDGSNQPVNFDLSSYIDWDTPALE